MVGTCGLHAKLWLLIINVNVLLWYNTFIQLPSLWSQMLNAVKVTKGNLVKTNTKKSNGSVHAFLTRNHRVGAAEQGWFFSMQHPNISLGSSVIFNSRDWPIIMLVMQKRTRKITQKAVWSQLCSYFIRDNNDKAVLHTEYWQMKIRLRCVKYFHFKDKGASECYG